MLVADAVETDGHVVAASHAVGAHEGDAVEPAPARVDIGHNGGSRSCLPGRWQNLEKVVARAAKDQIAR